LETGAQFELTLLVAEEPWADLIAPAAVPLKVNPDQLEMHKLEVREWEDVWENIESGVNSEEVGDTIYEDKWKPTLTKA